MYVARLTGFPIEACNLRILKHLLEGNIQSGLCLSLAQPELAPRYDVEPTPMWIVEARLRAKDFWLHHHRNPNVRSGADFNAEETSLSDTPNVERMIVDANCFPNGVRVSTEVSLPKVVAQHGHRMRQRSAVVFAGEKPSQRRPSAECGEEVPGNQLCGGALRAAGCDDSYRHCRAGKHAGKYFVVFTQVAESGIGKH